MVGTFSRASLPARSGQVLLVVLALLLAGCQGGLMGVKGRTVHRESRIPVPPSGEHSASWETRDLSLDYQYMRQADALTISGRVRFSDAIKGNFDLIQYFHMDVILVDDQGKVLDMVGLTSGSYGNSDYPQTFSKTFRLPPGTTSMAFSYRGQAYSGDDEDGSSAYFWEYPVR